MRAYIIQSITNFLQKKSFWRLRTSQASDFGPPSSSKSNEADFLPPLDLTKRSFIHVAVAHMAYQVICSAGQLENADLANTDQTLHCEKNLEEEANEVFFYDIADCCCWAIDAACPFVVKYVLLIFGK